jgi:hypothetical protein
VYCGLAKIYTVSASGTHTDITRATGGDYTATADTKWTGGELSGIMVVNNVNDVPQYWNGNTGTDMAALTGWTSTWRCRALRPLRNHLVAVNITKTSTNYPNMVKWSHAADPGAVPSSWDEADATKDAGEQDLADANGFLVDMVPLGDLGILYTTGSYHAMQYIGGTYIWRFTRLSEFAGALSQNCAVQYPGGHVVLTAGDIITHSGGAPTSIVNARIRSNLFSSIDTTNYGRSFVAHNEIRSEVWVCIPTAGATSCTRAYVWNYAQNSWGIRDLPNVPHANLGPIQSSTGTAWSDEVGTWAAATGSWDAIGLDSSKRRLMMASTDGRLFLADSGSTYDGTSTSMYVEKTDMSLGDSTVSKFVQSVRPKVDGVIGETLSVRVGATDYADGTITWSDPVTYTVGSTRAADFRVSGKFIGVKIEDTVGSPWRCRSMDIEYELDGKR